MRIKTGQTEGFRASLAVIAALLLLLASTLTACSGGDSGNHDEGNTDSNADQFQIIKEGETLVIPSDEISETAAFYPVTVDGTRMEVIAVKAPDGTIRTAFNTCQVCSGSPKAYFAQSGNTLQCQNCGNKFPMDKVEVEAGGCNPVPIFDKDKTVTDETITISYDILKENAKLFPSNWKQ